MKTVGPDWTFFASSWQKIVTHKSSPKILVSFWDISNNVTYMYKVCVYFLGQFFREIGQLATPSSGHTVGGLSYKCSMTIY